MIVYSNISKGTHYTGASIWTPTYPPWKCYMCRYRWQLQFLSWDHQPHTLYINP